MPNDNHKTESVITSPPATCSAESSDWPKPNDPDFATKLKAKCEAEATRMGLTMDEYLDRLACKLFFENRIPPNAEVSHAGPVTPGLG
jgi:hypothetical protein